MRLPATHTFLSLHKHHELMKRAFGPCGSEGEQHQRIVGLSQCLLYAVLQHSLIKHVSIES